MIEDLASMLVTVSAAAAACLSASVFRARTGKRSFSGGMIRPENYATLDNFGPWITAGSHILETGHGNGGVVLFGPDGKELNVTRIEFVPTLPGDPTGPPDRRYICTVDAEFNETGERPADWPGDDDDEWTFYPVSDLLPAWHALRAALMRGLGESKDFDRLESTPRAHELNVVSDRGYTSFTFHDTWTGFARKRVREVVDRAV
jgi:hypothetical protein